MLLLVLLSDVVRVDVGFVVFEAGAVLGATVIVERGAGFTFGDILIIHCRSIQSVVGVAFAGFGVARGESEDCNQGSGNYYFSFHIDCVFTFFLIIFSGLLLFPPEHSDNVHSVHFGDVDFCAVAIAAVVWIELAVSQLAAGRVVVGVGLADANIAPPRQQVAAAGFGAAGSKQQQQCCRCCNFEF